MGLIGKNSLSFSWPFRSLSASFASLRDHRRQNLRFSPHPQDFFLPFPRDLSRLKSLIQNTAFQWPCFVSSWEVRWSWNLGTRRKGIRARSNALGFSAGCYVSWQTRRLTSLMLIIPLSGAMIDLRDCKINRRRIAATHITRDARLTGQLIYLPGRSWQAKN